MNKAIFYISVNSYNFKMDGVLRVEEVNAMGNEQFVSIFNNIVESYPQAATAICNQRPFASADHLADAASNYLELLPLHGNNII
jgi:2-oxo-4-hydroxy-4-carboxy--5-ureidoimidazoline (OHCU) decarboxylase